MSLTVISYILVIVIFALYFPVFYGRTKIRSFFALYFPTRQVEIASYLFEKLSGFVLMLVLPVLVFSIYNGHTYLDLYGSNPPHLRDVLPRWILFALIGLALLVNFLNTRKPESYEQYPQLRSDDWNIGLLLLYLGGWFLYLFAYEYLFRGLLFWHSYHMPLELNIAINCILYALAHIPKGKKEVWGSLPFGVILCLLTLYAGGFWPAFWLHFALASSNSIFALFANPNIKFHWKLI